MTKGQLNLIRHFEKVGTPLPEAGGFLEWPVSSHENDRVRTRGSGYFHSRNLQTRSSLEFALKHGS